MGSSVSAAGNPGSAAESDAAAGGVGKIFKN